MKVNSPTDVTISNTVGVSSNRGKHPGHQVYARGDHGCGVNQGADGCRAFHRIGQPYVKRELGRLAHRPQEYQEGGDVERGLTDRPILSRHVDDGGYLERARGLEQQYDADEQRNVADASGHERFLGRFRGGAALVPETYQQV